MSAIRVRFAPSPTGYLHVGGARTALFNWLYARKTGGTMVLRIEDTDAERSTNESYEAILDAMEWLGLDWDEGPARGGDYGPYLQSARTVMYCNEADRLLQAGRAYRCFCTPEELDELRREELEAGRPPRYDGRCRRLPADEVDARVRRGVPHTIRFAVEPGQTHFYDIVRGEFTFDNAELDDFVIVKSDGRPTYNFAVVVDDAKMEITHVIRGDDHLSNTPKQVCAYKALGYHLPRFAHLPMILGGDRTRLSKRHGATSVQEYRARGYLPDAVVNYLALLGWSLDGTTEVFTREQLVEKFSLKRVSKNPAAFDEDKLRYINAEHFKMLDPKRRLTLVYNELVTQGILPADFHAEEWRMPDDFSGVAVVNGGADPRFTDEVPRIGFILNVMGNRLTSLADVPRTMRYFFRNDYERDPEAFEKYLSAPETGRRLRLLADRLEAVETFSHEEIESALRGLAAELGIKAGELIHPCRVAISGRAVSPDIFAVLQLIGRHRSTARLRETADEVAGR